MTTAGPKETVWITGSSGFLGNRLVRQFSDAGHHVVGMSRRGCTAPESLRIDLSAAGSVSTLRRLLTNGSAPDVVIHAASKQPGSGDLADFIASNVQASRNLVEALTHRPPRKLIYTSTQSVYHRPINIPVKEEAPAGGTLPYSATKRWGEQLFESLKHRSDVIVLRLPSLYGRGQADSFVDGFARSAIKGERIELFSHGEIIRDALHVSDVVQAIVSCVGQTRNAGYVVMNLGCGKAVKAFEYAETIVSILNSSSEIVRSDRAASYQSVYGDIERARQQIGFKPRSLAESMREYANELRA